MIRHAVPPVIQRGYHPEVDTGSHEQSTFIMPLDVSHTSPLDPAVADLARRLDQTPQEDVEAGSELIDRGLRTLATWDDRRAETSSDPSDIWLALADRARALGRKDDALRLSRAAHEVRTERFGAEHPDCQTTARKLASCAFEARDLATAARTWEALVRRWENERPSDDPDLRTIRVDLALALRELGRLDRARQQCEIVLRETTATETSDGSAQRARAALARIHYAEARYDEARKLEERLLQDAETEGAGPEALEEHRVNLASTYWKIGDLEAARRLEQQALTSAEDRLGAQHPRTLSFLLNLLFTCLTQGDFEAVREGLGRIDEAPEDIWEAEPSIRLSLRDLRASWLTSSGDSEAALAIRRELHPDFVQEFGPRHFKTDGHLRQLVDLELKVGEPRRAIDQLRKALADEGSSPAPNDHRVRELRNSLGISLQEGECWDEALEHYRDRQRALDAEGLEDDAERLECLWGLGSAMNALDSSLEELEAILRQTLEISRRHLGEDHQETWTTAQNLGATLFRSGQFEEAADLYHQVFHQRKAHLGPLDPETWTTLFALGMRLDEADEEDAAVEVLAAGIELAREAEGLAHRSAQGAFDRLARLLYSRGNRDQALLHHLEALEALENVDGVDATLPRRIQKAIAWETADERDAALALLEPWGEEILASQVLTRTSKAWALELLGVESAGREGQVETASRYLQTAVFLRHQEEGPDAPGTLNTSLNLAATLGQLGRHEAAWQLAGSIVEGLGELRDIPEDRRWLGPLATTAMGQILLRAGLETEALDILQRALALRMEFMEPDHPDVEATRRLVEDLERRIHPEPGSYHRWWNETIQPKVN